MMGIGVPSLLVFSASHTWSHFLPTSSSTRELLLLSEIIIIQPFHVGCLPFACLSPLHQVPVLHNTLGVSLFIWYINSYTATDRRETFLGHFFLFYTHSMEQNSSWEVTSYQLVKKVPAFKEPEGSLPHSQMSATCPYPGPHRSSPCPHIPLPDDPS